MSLHLLVLYRADPQPGLSHAAGRGRSARFRYDDFAFWWQRKVVWFWDDNLTIRREYVRELLARMAPLKRWWLTQASMDIARDAPLLDLMRRPGCIGIFFGIESFGEDRSRTRTSARTASPSTRADRGAAPPRHLRDVGFYRRLRQRHARHHPGHGATALRDRRGRPVPEHSDALPWNRLHRKFEEEGRSGRARLGVLQRIQRRVRAGADDPGELLDAHRALWREAFSLRASLSAFSRVCRLRLGAFLMCA